MSIRRMATGLGCLGLLLTFVIAIPASPAEATPPPNQNCPITIGGPGVRPDLEGFRLRDPVTGEVDLILDGTRHWIPNPGTYNNLFRDWNGIVNVIDLGAIANGGGLSNGAVLVQTPGQPEVWLVSNGVRRWIESPWAMDRYYFSWYTIQVIPQIVLNAVPIGANIC